MRSSRFYLAHMLDQLAYLLEASSGLTKAAFLRDQTLILAFERSLEIIGEAAGKLDDDFKEAHTEIPWRKVRGLRNIIAHGYWDVDYDIVWHVITEDVPRLHAQLRTLLDTLEEDE